MALADLDPTVAVTLATELTTIYDCPRSNIAINAMAEDLMRWCRGWIGNNNVWPPEAQARWLVREAREKWTEKWLGTGALKQLLDARFPPTVVPGNAAQPLGEKLPVICSHCNDTGIIRVRGKHQYCDCDLGARIRTDAGDKAKPWLERMDVSMRPRSVPERRLVKKASLPELEAEYYKQHPQPKEEPEAKGEDDA